MLRFQKTFYPVLGLCKPTFAIARTFPRYMSNNKSYERDPMDGILPIAMTTQILHNAQLGSKVENLIAEIRSKNIFMAIEDLNVYAVAEHLNTNPPQEKLKVWLGMAEAKTTIIQNKISRAWFFTGKIRADLSTSMAIKKMISDLIKE